MALYYSTAIASSDDQCLRLPPAVHKIISYNCLHLHFCAPSQTLLKTKCKKITYHKSQCNPVSHPLLRIALFLHIKSPSYSPIKRTTSAAHAPPQLRVGDMKPISPTTSSCHLQTTFLSHLNNELRFVLLELSLLSWKDRICRLKSR